MLLLYLIDQDNFRSCFSERVEQNSRWNGDKQEHIQKNEQNEEPINPKGILDGQELVIGIGIIG